MCLFLKNLNCRFNFVISNLTDYVITHLYNFIIFWVWKLIYTKNRYCKIVFFIGFYNISCKQGGWPKPSLPLLGLQVNWNWQNWAKTDLITTRVKFNVFGCWCNVLPFMLCLSVDALFGCLVNVWVLIQFSCVHVLFECLTMFECWCNVQVFVMFVC